MNQRRVVFSTVLVLVGASIGMLSVLGSRRMAADDSKAGPDQAAIRKMLESFAAAFNSGNAKAVAASFTAAGEYVGEDGDRIEGAAGIEAMMTKFLAANAGAKVQISPKGVRLVAPNVAVEDGESTITVADKNSQSVRQYVMVLAKADGNWKIASLREFPEEVESTTDAEKLKALEFLIGDWIDEGGDSLMTVTCSWSPDKSHIIRDFSVRQQNQELLKGTQRIGVDPATGSIKGWAFDSQGGHGESTWTPNGDEWLIRGSGVNGDGDDAAATFIIKPINKDRIELKTMHRVVAGTVEPDATTTFVRKLAK